MHDHAHHNHTEHVHEESTPWFEYIKFAIVLLVIAGLSWLYATHISSIGYMRSFMAVFFIVFSVFKLIDLKGFVAAFMGYDIIARQVPSYGYFYPFLELLLGLGYLVNNPWVSYLVVPVMAIGTIGVARELLRGRKVKCACLGTYIKLPLTTVSLVEDVVMGLMALSLIIF